MADAITCNGGDCNLCGPSWWGVHRGCYEQAKRNYATNVRAKPITSGSPDNDDLKSHGFIFDRLGDPVWKERGE